MKFDKNFKITKTDCKNNFCYEISSELQCAEGFMLYDEKCKLMENAWNNVQEIANIPSKFRSVNRNTVKPFNEVIEKYLNSLLVNIYEGKGLLLQGHVGTGKTTQAVLILSEALALGVRASYFLPFLSDYLLKIDSFNTREEKFYFIEFLQETPLLIVDDFMLINFSPLNESIFWAIINKRFDNEKATIFTMNLSKKDTQGNIPENIKDRLLSTCQSIVMAGESKREKA